MGTSDVRRLFAAGAALLEELPGDSRVPVIAEVIDEEHTIEFPGDVEHRRGRRRSW